MDAKESVVVHNLKEITECYVCKETMKNPKILPCIHTFCLKCLQQNGATMHKVPEDAMPCPICRKEFTIPQKGFGGLKKNLFMERLVKIKVLMVPLSSESLCNSCLEPDISDAEMYCRDCDDKFCANCCASHIGQKAFRKHEFFTLRMEEATSQNLQEIVASCCEVHEEKQLMYCTDCSETICVHCFQESHQNHRLADISLVAKNFREQIQNNISFQSEYETGVKRKKQNLDNDEAIFLRKVDYLQSAVNEARDDMIQLVNEEADSLIQKVDALRKKRLIDFKAEKEYYDRYQTTLESFKNCCINLITIGSPSDVCWATDDINTRSNELDEEYVSLDGRTFHPFPVYFRKSEMKENIVGQIKDERGYAKEPKLIRSLKVAIDKGTDTAISGLAVLDKTLFFTRRRSSSVQIIDLTKNVLCQEKMEDLKDPRDLRSCERNLCLYIIDWKYEGNSNMIFRVDTNGKLIKKWSIGSIYGRISVTHESNVLLAVHSEMKLNEYSCDGQLIREIKITMDTDAKHPWHAVSLPNGHFLVSLNAKGEQQHRICTVDCNGDFVRSTGQMEQVDVPVCLVFDGDGSVIVADQFNSRFLLYSLNPGFKRELITEKHGLRNLPVSSFDLHEPTGQLFVTFSDEEIKNIIQVFSI